MKKALSAFLLIPSLSWAATTLDCSQLGQTVQRLQTKLSNKFSQELCDTRTNKLDQTECSSLATLETRLDQLRNAQTLLAGMEKLKTDIRDKKEKLKKTPVRNSQRPALNLAEAIIVAQSMELLVNTTSGDANLVSEIKSSMAADPKLDLKAAVSLFCKKRPVDAAPKEGAVDACSADQFKPTKAAVEEISLVIKNTDINPSLLSQWQDSLRIQRAPEDGKKASPYSFTQMKSEIGLDDDGNLPQNFTAEQLATLKALPDFRDAPQFDFMKDLNSSKEIALVKDDFIHVTKQLSDRQKLEIEARASTAFETFKDKFNPAADADSCKIGRQDYEAALQCMKSMRDGLAQMTDATAKNELLRLLSAMDISTSYVDEVSAKSQACLTEIESNLKSDGAEVSVPTCEGVITQDLASIQTDIDRLTVIKTKILEDHANLLTMRDYAVSQLEAKECGREIKESTCDPTFQSSITKEMTSLTTDAMTISLLLAKPEEDVSVNIDPLCGENDFTNEPDLKALCAHNDEDGAPAEELSRPRPSSPRLSRSLEKKSSPVVDGFAQGFSQWAPWLAQQMAYSNMARINPNTFFNPNPYPTMNYNPYQAGIDYSTFLGLTYQSTPGLQPYSSIPTTGVSAGTYVFY